MRNIRNKYKFITGVFLTFVLGVGGGAMTMAAIPSSSTSLITACRDDSTGSLRVVDTDNSESCVSGESQVVWSGEQSAVLRVVYDPERLDEGIPIPSTQYSRGILGTKKVFENGEGSNLVGFCVHLAFQPLYANSSSLASSSYDAHTPGVVSGACGSGYEAFIACPGSCVDASPYYFTN